MEFVCWYCKVLRHDPGSGGHQVMLKVQPRGIGICGVYPVDAPTTKSAASAAYLRKHHIHCMRDGRKRSRIGEGTGNKNESAEAANDCPELEVSPATWLSWRARQKRHEFITGRAPAARLLDNTTGRGLARLRRENWTTAEETYAALAEQTRASRRPRGRHAAYARLPAA